MSIGRIEGLHGRLMGCARRCLLLGALATLALALSAAGALAADTVTVDSETGPTIGTPVTDQYLASAFTFWQRADPGFRPYRRVAGVPTQSGTVAADIGPAHCYPRTTPPLASFRSPAPAPASPALPAL